jgi:metallophosphoesterase (TIGR00282 family)
VTALLANEPRFIRPMNYPPETPGSGVVFWKAPTGITVAVINVQGLTFMPALDSPFRLLRKELPAIKKKAHVIFVDMHAEATSEKIAIARMLDGQVSAVVGTHTHVQTADEQIFPGGTAFLCDAGFTGGHESVLGREIDPVITRFLTNMPQRFQVAAGRIFLQGVIIEINDASGKALHIQRVSEPLPKQAPAPATTSAEP